MDITSISYNVLGEASQAMDSGVYLVQCVKCPTVPNSGVLVGSSGFWIENCYVIHPLIANVQ